MSARFGPIEPIIRKTVPAPGPPLKRNVTGRVAWGFRVGRVGDIEHACFGLARIVVQKQVARGRGVVDLVSAYPDRVMGAGCRLRRHRQHGARRRRGMAIVGGVRRPRGDCWRCSPAAWHEGCCRYPPRASGWDLLLLAVSPRARGAAGVDAAASPIASLASAASCVPGVWATAAH